MVALWKFSDLAHFMLLSFNRGPKASFSATEAKKMANRPFVTSVATRKNCR